MLNPATDIIILHRRLKTKPRNITQLYDEVILVLSAPLIIVQEMFEFDIIGKGHSGQISFVISCRMNIIVARLKKVGIIDWKVLSLRTCSCFTHVPIEISGYLCV